MESSPPLGTPQNPFLLTPTDFGVSVQEVVLVHRYGGEPEAADMPDSARRDLYRIAQETMPDRELNFSVDVSVPGLTTRLVCKRMYHAERKIVRLVYLSKDAPRPEKIGPKPQDETAVLISLWAARRVFSTPPEAGVIMHYTFDPVRKNPITGAFAYPVIYDEGRAESIIQEKLFAIRDALALPDAALPPCDETDRHAQKNDPFHKCKFYCRARTYCPQARAVVRPSESVSNKSPLLIDDDGE